MSELYESLPFGRHRGEPLALVPPDYLEWLLSQSNVVGDLARSIRLSLEEDHGVVLDRDPREVSSRSKIPHAQGRRNKGGVTKGGVGGGGVRFRGKLRKSKLKGKQGTPRRKKRRARRP